MPWLRRAANRRGSGTIIIVIDGLDALLNCVRWITSASWDGRWAMAVCSVAGGPLCGGAAVAMLVGPQAPVPIPSAAILRGPVRWPGANGYGMMPIATIDCARIE